MSTEVDTAEAELLERVNLRHGLWNRHDVPAVLARSADSTTFAVASCVIRHSEDGEALSRETALLGALARATAVPVPVPLVHDPGLGVLVSERLPGAPIIRRGRWHSASVEHALVEVLAALRRIGASAGLPLDRYPDEGWHREAVRGLREIRSHLRLEQIHLIEAFLAGSAPPTRKAAVPQHNDLGAEHILVDDAGRVTGIIDWADAALTDPARDLGSLLRDLGEDAAFRVATGLGIALTDEEVARIRFYARCRWIEDVAYALLDVPHRRGYLANAERTFRHTFSASV